MTTLGDIRQAMVDVLAQLEGMNVAGFQTDQVTPPQATIFRGAIDYDLTFDRGADTYSFTVRVAAPRSDELAAQVFFDELCSPSGSGSLKTILEADNALSLLGVDVRVRSATEVQVIPGTDPNVEYLAVDFDMDMLVSNS